LSSKVVAVSNEVAPVTWAESPLGGQGDMQINEGAPLRPHVALARIRAYSGTDQLFFNAGIRQKIVYGGPGSLVGRRELREIRSHCVGIVESFAPSREGKVPRSWYRFWYPPDVI
jgi:hypothetical protein